MTVVELLEWALKEKGYDGLLSPDAECGCKIGDLVPCESPCDLCRAAYLHSDGWFYTYKEGEE